MTGAPRSDPNIIDGELVAAPRVLGTEPAGPQVVHLRCDTHPDWIDCGLDQATCVPFAERPSSGVRDRRRLSYPRLTAEEFKNIEEKR